MLSRRIFLRSAAMAAASAPLASGGLLAQTDDYPSRDIRSVCGFSAGSGADVFVRFYGKLLQDRVGRTVITENRLGAFGNIATEYVARSKPDGHTLFIAPGSSFLAAAPSLFKSLAFDPVNDFEHITTLSKLPFVLLVAGDGPFKTVPELVAFLKERGDKASYGSVANTGLVSSELFKANFGLQTVEVKYKGFPAMLSDLWSGQLAFVHLDPIGAAGFIANGKVRPLATSSRDRFKALPNIPGAAEVGIENSDIIAWWSVHAPKGTPKPILAKLERLFNEIAASEEHTKFLAPFGSDPFLGNSTMLKELLVKDIKAWAEYVKLAKIEVQG
jgi:tripartite-type tricarboxylate transporter receptor subunit TctC